MKLNKMVLALGAAFASMARQKPGCFGAIGGVLNIGDQENKAGPRMPIQSMWMQPYEITAAVAVTQADHAGRTGVFNVAAGAVVTLPRATGSGAQFSFFCRTTITSNAMKIQVANADDTISGVQLTAQDAADTLVAFETASTSDTWSGNGTTTGGIKGDWVTFEDVAPGLWRVLGIGSATGTEATPFSAAVS